MRKFRAYKWYMVVTILCGVIFLVVKLAYEWPEKFHHFGAHIKTEALEKYEPYLGNKHLLEKGHEPRIEITGHLHNHDGVARSEHPRIRNRARSGECRSDQSRVRSPAFLARPRHRQDRARRQEGRGIRRDVPAELQHLFRDLLYDHRACTALHVLGGVLVFIYLWLPVGANLYKRNPEHLANRVEVAGLFWHFVDLVWIFVFPLFYLL